LDLEAQGSWGFNVFSLIEAAGRLAAQRFTGAYPAFFEKPPRITIAAGTGNNAADAMTMLRYWILSSRVEAASSALLLSRLPKNGETGPWVDLFGSLEKMKVPVFVWDSSCLQNDILSQRDIIVDGIAGTGLSGPLRGTALEMVNAINLLGNESSVYASRPFVVSVDVPSGNSDEWQPGMPMIKADLTLAIEPQKYCLYTPGARALAGKILPVGGIFPKEIIDNYKGAELLEWEDVRGKISKIRPEAYKHERGTVEIRAGSPGATGAAMIAARGSQAAGAGLVRLVTDEDIYPILASQAAGVMVTPDSGFREDRWKPDAMVLGPGWGNTKNRAQTLEKALFLERSGTALILDADAIELAKDKDFHGNVIFTPHPGEFCKITGLKKEELLARTAPLLLRYAKEHNGVLLFKSHVITIAAPDGRLGIVDGMSPGLAAGGSGDLLAGFCGAIAARMLHEGRSFDAYTVAAAASALLIASARYFKTRFTDPMELAGKAADLAGEAWLNQDENSSRSVYG
jgi:NAD(P)H-hydrate epimerase